MPIEKLFDNSQSMAFRNISRSYANFDEVFADIINFLKQDREASYRISVGTDSQVCGKTVFVTCIHVHRIGKGAIGFLHRSEIGRRVKSLREKIYLETCLSLKVAYMFDDEKMREINDILITLRKNDSKHVTFEFHIDIGRKGDTKVLINEMVGMVKGINFTPKIKPESYCASNYADRYTKAI